MSKLKAAFYIFTKSLTSPAYYKDIIQTEFRFSMKYFLVLALLASLITFPTTVKPILKDLNKGIETAKSEVIEKFPEDLTITISEGLLSINKPEPLIFPMPEEKENTGLEEEKTYTNLLVIDSKGTLDDLEKYDTLILANQTNLLVRTSNKVEVYPLSDYPDTTINKQAVEGFMEELSPLIESLPYIVLVTAFLGTIFFYFGVRLIYLLFVALILMAFGALKGLKLGYSKYYQVGIHSLTLPLLIEVFSGVFEFPINLPFWFLGLNLLIGILGIVSVTKGNIDTNN